MKYFEKDDEWLGNLLKRTKKPVTGSVIMPATTSSARIGATKAPGSSVTKAKPKAKPGTEVPVKKDTLGRIGAGGLGLGIGVAAGSILD